MGALLPHFIIIGAQRCGTTSLFHYLEQHPQLKLSRQKEIHYFDRHYALGIDWYQSFFPASLMQEKTGEASPNYLLHPHAPRRIKREMPEVQLIVLLRNPVERAYSHYQGKRIMGVEPLESFEEALDQENERTHGEIQKVLNDPGYYSSAYRNFTYISRGMYFEQITRWLDEFDIDQFLFVLSEDLFHDPWVALASIHSFLGIDPVCPNDLSPRGVGRLGVGHYPPLAEETVSRLQDIFQEDVSLLSDLIGDRFDWFREQ